VDIDEETQMKMILEMEYGAKGKNKNDDVI